jgi:hypothetical protein
MGQHRGRALFRLLLLTGDRAVPHHDMIELVWMEIFVTAAEDIRPGVLAES